MKRLIIALFVGWMLASTELVYGLSAGFYGGDHTISAGESADIEFRFTGQGPVDFSYTDGMYFYHVYNVSESPYSFSVSPITTTTYELCVVQNSLGDGTILESNKYVTVYVGSGGGTTVQMTFTPPNLCQNANPVNLENYFWSNTTGQTWFRGDGVVNNIFNPQLAGAGAHQLEAYLLASNGQTYSVSRNVTVFEMPEVTLWLPSEVFLNEPSFVLSGGRPSGGYYWGDGVMNSSTFNPAIAGEGWHTIYYTYTTSNGCQEVAENKIYVRRSGYDVEETLVDSFEVYPNPTDGILYFTNPCSVEVFSTIGLVKRENVLVESVDISSLSSGVYVLRLFDGENIFVKRIVKN